MPYHFLRLSQVFFSSPGESANAKETLERKSTRLWASEINFDAEKLLAKFFAEDIKYLLSMENLWKKRKPPTPLEPEVLRRVKFYAYANEHHGRF